MRTAVLMLTIVASATACSEVDAARCKKGDYACIQAALDPADVEGAIMYAGPCYRAGRELCDHLEYCTGALRDREACVAWWVETVCLLPQDPAVMDGCAELGKQLACEAYDSPDTYYSRPLSESACWRAYQHPLGGADAYDGDPPPGA
jgi:hypothetical protein